MTSPYIVPDLPHRRLVVFGELHGSKEIPEIVGENACRVVDAGRPVVVALEIPTAEQERIDAFLSSAGTEIDKTRLTSSSFWRARLSQQDGRRSRAIADLIERARTLHQQGKDIRVLAYDAPSKPMQRDAGMAQKLEEYLRSQPDRIMLVLTGNIHASKAKGTPFDAEYLPMAYYLQPLEPLSLNVRALSGSVWVCGDSAAECGPRAFRSPAARADSSPGPGVHLEPTRQAGFDGLILLKEINASPPAALELLEAHGE